MTVYREYIIKLKAKLGNNYKDSPLYDAGIQGCKEVQGAEELAQTAATIAAKAALNAKKAYQLLELKENLTYKSCTPCKEGEVTDKVTREKVRYNNYKRSLLADYYGDA